MAKKEAKVNKDKKSSFKTFKAELKKVIWPTPKQLINNTMAVVAIVIILAAIVFVLDVAFESVNKYGIDKIKQSVVSTNSTENTVDSNNTTTETSTEENVTSEVTSNTEVVENTNNVQANTAE
jgi:preprotein translocase SecE subunit